MRLSQSTIATSSFPLLFLRGVWVILCLKFTDCEGCHISWICSGTGVGLAAILTAAILQNDGLLQSWLNEVLRFRRSKTIWHASSEKYIFALNKGGVEVLEVTYSNIDAIQHVIGNPHR